MNREDIIEECARLIDERADENWKVHKILRPHNPDAAANFNISAREDAYCAAAIRWLKKTSRD